MLNPVSADMICGLSCDGCCDGAREDVIATVIGATDGTGVVSLPQSPDMLDATNMKTTGAGVWSLPDAVVCFGRMAWQMIKDERLLFLTKTDQRVSSAANHFHKSPHHLPLEPFSNLF